MHNNWRNDTANWKLGFLYFNRSDKRLLVPKRLGIGYTFNFGNPLAIVLVALLFIIPIVVAVFFS